jgi:hypothetical protein
MFIVQFSAGTYEEKYKRTFIIYDNLGIKRINEKRCEERSVLEYGRQSFEQQVSWISPFKLEILTE